MTAVDATPDAMEARWRAWQARGVETDRRWRATMRGVAVVVVVAASVVGGWFFLRPM